MPVRVRSSEGLGSTARCEPDLSEDPKNRGIDLHNCSLMRQRGELVPALLTPPRPPEVNSGKAFREAAAPRTD